MYHSDEIFAALDWVTYRSFATNRALFPEIEPERWGIMFSDYKRYEEIYQKEIEQQKKELK